MPTHDTALKLSRRELLQAGLAAGATLSTWPLYRPPALWGQDTTTPKRGGILHARGWDPVHFDPHLTRNFMTHTALSLLYSKLLRHKAGPDVGPGPSSSSLIGPNAGRSRTTPPTSSICVRASNGITSRPSTVVSWWPKT
jgi:hypothetical protein